MVDNVWTDLHKTQEEQDLRLFGSKFVNLARISRTTNLSVPPGVGLSFDTVAGIDRRRNDSGKFIDTLILPHMRELKRKDRKPERYRQLVVRSSADVEDGATVGFPGVFESETNVSLSTDEILKAIMKVFSSGTSERAKAFASSLPGANLSRGSSKTEVVRMGCIIQWQVDAVVSGVTMTSTNNTLCDEYALLNITEGPCKNVVEGRSSNEIIYSKGDQIIVNAKCRDMLDLLWDGTVAYEEFAARREKRSWNLGTLHEVVQDCIEIERLFARPFDIEWSVDHEGEVQILQARPIVQKSAFSLAPGM